VDKKLLVGLTFLRTIFNALPIASPFLAPFKGQVAALADLGWEAVFGFSLHTFITWLSLRGNFCIYLLSVNFTESKLVLSL
jgi:hypothetical protein